MVRSLPISTNNNTASWLKLSPGEPVAKTKLHRSALPTLAASSAVVYIVFKYLRVPTCLPTLQA